MLAADLTRDDLQAQMALARVGEQPSLVNADLAPGPDDFHKSTQSAIIMVPVCLCERQPRPISPGLNETVGWPAKQASGTM